MLRFVFSFYEFKAILIFKILIGEKAFSLWKCLDIRVFSHLLYDFPMIVNQAVSLVVTRLIIFTLHFSDSLQLL